jgi:hypothetical protein
VGEEEGLAGAKVKSVHCENKDGCGGEEEATRFSQNGLRPHIYPSVDIALRYVRVNEAAVRSRFPNPAGATKYQSLP